ncbi:MOSC N-terminal beta barrel domain-containing protein [Microbacterium sp. NPDC076911]|uniref:MOSC domain-containing protein n=1 Tax=Microbacterium sp. NPDC076911 TaxID=3154958 RepID=UPI00341DB10B
MKVTRLRVYPVKSLAGLDVDTAEVHPWGLEGDRRWAVVAPDGSPVTAREANQLLSLRATTLENGGLRIDSATDSMHIDVPFHAESVAVGHAGQGTALPADAAANAWLSAQLARPVRLVWQSDPKRRAVDPTEGGLAGDHVSLADVAPLLLTSESSLTQLDEWTDAETAPLDMVRFRPNIVVDGDPATPFAEDSWSRIQLGDVRLRVLGPCDRCVMTSINPSTLERGKEPIRTLAKHRRWDGKIWFGIWLVPDLSESAGSAMIALNDACTAQ